MPDAGLEAGEEVISFLFLLKQEAGVACVGQVEMHSKRIWIEHQRRRVLLHSWKHKDNVGAVQQFVCSEASVCATRL